MIYTHSCRHKLACQLQLSMEHQLRALGDTDVSLHLHLPWSVGALMDDHGVTFVYLSVPRESDGKRVLVRLNILLWTTHLHAIIRCLSVIRVCSACYRSALAHTAAGLRRSVLGHGSPCQGARRADVRGLGCAGNQNGGERQALLCACC